MKKWKSNISERTIIIAIILSVLAVGGLIFYAFIYLLYHIRNYWWIVGFVLYFILIEAVCRLSARSKKGFIRKVELIILSPLIAMKLLLDIAKPALYVFMSFFYLVMVVFIIPFALLKGFNLLLSWNLNYSSMLFVAFAFGSIICVHQSKIVQYIICKLPPMDRGEHKYQKLGRDLSKYILHPKNLSFLLFLSYFIYLAISGFIQLQYTGFLISEDIDNSILKAFLVFIACTNMVTKSREVDVEAKDLLDRMYILINAHD